MHELKKLDIAAIWEGLEWTSGRLVLKQRKGEPLEAEHAPKKPGLYRITWDGDWKGLPAQITVMASRKIADPLLHIEQLQPPVLLTIGRTTDIYGRIRQHLGTNENSNRLFMRLKRMLSHLTDAEIRLAAMRNLLVQWVAVPMWSHRCLLERYGSAVCTPLLDIDAEH
jgi:hypothetical protein